MISGFVVFKKERKKEGKVSVGVEQFIVSVSSQQIGRADTQQHLLCARSATPAPTNRQLAVLLEPDRNRAKT